MGMTVAKKSFEELNCTTVKPCLAHFAIGKHDKTRNCPPDFSTPSPSLTSLNNGNAIREHNGKLALIWMSKQTII